MTTKKSLRLAYSKALYAIGVVTSKGRSGRVRPARLPNGLEMSRPASLGSGTWRRS